MLLKGCSQCSVNLSSCLQCDCFLADLSVNHTSEVGLALSPAWLICKPHKCCWSGLVPVYMLRWLGHVFSPPAAACIAVAIIKVLPSLATRRLSALCFTLLIVQNVLMWFKQSVYLLESVGCCWVHYGVNDLEPRLSVTMLDPLLL